MSNEITINITASGKSALRILNALSKLDGVEVKTSTKKAKQKTEAKKGLNSRGTKPRITGRFSTRKALDAFLLSHCIGGNMNLLTVAQAAEAAQVNKSTVYNWARANDKSFKKGKAGKNRS